MKNKLTETKFKSALRLARHLFVAAAVFLWVDPSGATQPAMVTGGGTGTFNADLDGDGEIDGSHFGFAVTQNPGGVVLGHFMCQMAGNEDFLGLKLMLVEGRVSSASFTTASVTFSGTGSVNLANGTVFTGVPFTVTVSAGGPEVGTMQLTVIGLFDGVPGDTIPGDNNYSLPVETVVTGLISID
jgi:hypothetical protein